MSLDKVERDKLDAVNRKTERWLQEMLGFSGTGEKDLERRLRWKLRLLRRELSAYRKMEGNAKAQVNIDRLLGDIAATKEVLQFSEDLTKLANEVRTWVRNVRRD